MAKRRRDSGAESAVSTESHHDNDQPGPPSKKSRVEEKKTLFVRSLPPTATKDSLTDWFSQHYPVKHATVVLDAKTKTSRGYGFVTFTDPEDASAAKEKLNRTPFDGRRLKLEFAESRHRGAGDGAVSEVVSAAIEEKRKRKDERAEARRPPKLIVRNLPWSIKSSDQLAALFNGFGKIRFADLPNNKGKLSGFGFVTLRGKKNAENAIEGINGKVVDGRTLAVDWAVDKATWEQQKGVEEAGEDEDDGGPSSESEEDLPKATKKSNKASTTNGEADGDEDEDLRNFFENHMENLEDEESNASEPEADSEKDDSKDGTEAPVKKRQLSTDNSTTLFIRNLPFTTTEEQLKSHFMQFGPVRYARCVIERSTDRPAGTGFVCFFELDDFKSCLRDAPRQQPSTTLVKHSVLQNESVDHDGRYTIEGRVLQVSQAVSKEEATRLATEAASTKHGAARDKRRLFLLAEGTIPTNSPLAGLMTPSELKMREASAKQRKKMADSNPSLFVSLTRLALRNIPKNLDSKGLKALAREAVVEFAKDVEADRRQPLSREEIARGGLEDKEAERRRKVKGQGVVRQAKIIFESREGSKVTDQQAGGKSRGYGFIEYSSHRWALMGLRWLNGHALKNEGGKTQRLIVEFAMENAQVVARRRNAEEKSRSRVVENKVPGSRRTGGTDNEAEQGKSGKAAKRNAKGKGLVKGEETTGKSAREGDSKLATRQQIIGRKRMLRKKKRGVSGSKK